MKTSKPLEKDGLSQKRILIVDDEEAFRGTLRDFVLSLGYLCVEADTAQGAMDLLRKMHVPIVISDIVMPEKDGLELLCLIKKRYPDVDVLIVTGHENRHSPSKIIEAGASDFLAKPFRLEQLKARLFKIEKEKILRKKIYESSITDDLTGLYNRRHFYRKLKQETERAKRQGYPLSLILFDLNGFKRFNDRYGHLKGDALLEAVARVVRVSLRENVDWAFRYGGDEFVVILPEADYETALSIARRLKAKFKDEAPGGLTLSMGIAQFQKDFDSESFFHLADQRMYKEKRKSKELAQFQWEADLARDKYYIRCLTCDSLVHWTSHLCENCLADPRKTVSEKGEKVAREVLMKPVYRTNERRKSSRIKMGKTFFYDGLRGTIQNISRGGLQIMTKTPLSVGKPIRMAFNLENAFGRFVGSVVYAQPLSDGNLLVGVEFTRLSDKGLQLLKGFLDVHCSLDP